ncbi:hypothetical protein FRB96_004940 [Tulasnella sp. 330]|nr:hypothetical protein FRB96_004940 [Tulasnella sp. 330]
MVASTDSSSPLVVVIGVTGQQGGSVASALIDSAKPYRIVGLTRDASKPKAKAWTERGVNILQVNISAENGSSIIKAFEGADVVFAVTSAGDLRTKESEIDQGKLMVDSAKAAKVKLFIWSNLESPAKWSKGQLTAVWPFDSKAEITDYLRESGIPHALVPAGGYFSNFFGGALALVKQPDGGFTLTKPCPATTVVPIVDIPHDYGTYVRAVIENPGMGAGSELLTGTMISYEDQLAQLSQFTGKKFTFRQVDREEWYKVVNLTGYPPQFGDVLYEMYEFTSKYGYYGDKDVSANQKAAGVTPPTFMEMLQNQKPDAFD